MLDVYWDYIGTGINHVKFKKVFKKKLKCCSLPINSKILLKIDLIQKYINLYMDILLIFTIKLLTKCILGSEKFPLIKK